MITSLDEKKGGRRRMEGGNVLFKETIEDLKLVDVVLGNNLFTWNKSRRGDRHITSCIDHFFVFESVMDLGSDISTLVLASMGSNHWLVCLWWSGLGSQFKNPFLFEQFWVGHSDFRNKV